MTDKWEELENKCHKYLLDIYGNYHKIEAFGKSDSTKADIKVITATNNEFFIEVKSKNSQCCQFVLFPNDETKEFDFSKKNKVPFLDSCKKITKYMSTSYTKYSKVNKKGISININDSVLYDLVKDYYSKKNVKFFMTENTDIIIFPLEKFSDYFDIEAIYRKKGSGSSEPCEKNNHSEILQGLSDENLLGTIEYENVGNKRRCFIHSDTFLHKKKIMCENYTYQFKDNKYSKTIAKTKQYVFEVRRLSNTNNPNVICELSLKKQTQNPNDLHSFEEIMKIQKED